MIATTEIHLSEGLGERGSQKYKTIIIILVINDYHRFSYIRSIYTTFFEVICSINNK